MANEPTSRGRARELRDRVLLHVYEHGGARVEMEVRAVQQGLGLSRQEIGEAVDVLHHQGLLRREGAIRSIALNQDGMTEAEQIGVETAMWEPRHAGVSNVTINANYSVVQVAGANGTQHASLTVDRSQVTHILEQIERAIPSLNLKSEEKEEASGIASGIWKGLAEMPAAAVRAMAASLSALLSKGDASDLASQLMEALRITDAR